MGTAFPQDEAVRLRALRTLGILDTPPEIAFDRVTQTAARACGKPVALISLVDEERQWFKSVVGLQAVRETPRADSICAYAISRDELLEIPDCREDPRFRENPVFIGRLGMRYYAGAPLILSDGERIGALCVMGYEPDRLDADRKALLLDLAQVVVSLLEQRLELRREVAGLTEAVAEAEASTTVRNQVLSTIARDVRNPLSSIIGFADLMRQQIYGPLPPRYSEAAEMIHVSGEAMLQLVDDLMDYSRLELERVVVDPRPTDVSYVVERTLTVLGPVATVRGVSLSFRSPEYLEFHLDERLLRQVLATAISQAIQLSVEGGTLVVSVARAETGLQMTIAEDRSGIPHGTRAGTTIPGGPENQGDTDISGDVVRDGRAGGHPPAANQTRATADGLGMPIAHKLAGLMGGRLEVGTSRDGGTYVVLHVPDAPNSRASESTAPNSGASETDAVTRQMLA